MIPASTTVTVGCLTSIAGTFTGAGAGALEVRCVTEQGQAHGFRRAVEIRDQSGSRDQNSAKAMVVPQAIPAIFQGSKGTPRLIQNLAMAAGRPGTLSIVIK